MNRLSDTLQTIGAFSIGLLAFGLVLISGDETPLLVGPGPDLGWPLGLLGVGMGMWSAAGVLRFRHTPKHRLARVALWVTLPTMLGFGLAGLGARAQEAVSFRGGGVKEEATVVIAEKNRRTSHRGVLYEAGLASPIDARLVELRIGAATFDRIEPGRDCARILIERAPNGAVRLLRPLQWKVPCA